MLLRETSPKLLPAGQLLAQILRAPVIGAILMFAHSFASAPAMGSESLPSATESVSSYASQLEALAKWCDAHHLPRQAELTRKWLPQREPDKIYVFALPDSDAAPAKLVDSPEADEWWQQFIKLRRERADQLFALAELAVKEKRYGEAYELVREAVRENPSHERGRAVLGFVQHDGRWVTPEAAQRLRSGKVWTDEFGWLPADQVARYEKGMRLYRGNWISAEDDARLHRNIRNGWRLESEHYNITTNHSLEEGARLAKQLELLNDVWRQTFLTYYAAPAEIERWFRKDQPASSSAPRAKSHQVVFFRDRQEYIDALKPYQPQIEISLGTYIDKVRTAYFFADQEKHDSTLFHEATHQLFREQRPGTVNAGLKNNFWITEAIACYAETLEEHRLLDDEPYGAYFTLGGINAGRVPAARQRSSVDNFYVPLRELVAIGMEPLQRDPRLPMIYSQSAGLAQFFMHANNGQYRPALMEYLIAVYTGRANSETLEKATGRRLEELDQEYREFIR